MRPTHFLIAIVLSIVAIWATAAELEFECGPMLFEKTAVEKPVDNDTNFGCRLVIDRSPSFDSPLYEGLWPMTLEAFRGDPRVLRKTSSDVTLPKLPASNSRRYEPRRIVSPVNPVVVNRAIPVLSFVRSSYDHPLYEGLWPATIEAFLGSDFGVQEVFSFCIASNE